MTNRTVRAAVSVILVFQSFYGLSQPGPDDIPCEAKWLYDYTQITDSIEFRLNCWTQIDFENDMCSWVLAEDYYNTVPRETSKLLCVVYFKDQIKTEEIELIKLFDNSRYRQEFLDRIQLIFVYDTTSGFNQAFHGKVEIENLFSSDIRNGFEKNE
ncbi:MAG: hypothetical protein ACFHU9_01350 [Fluviicola sp.]